MKQTKCPICGTPCECSETKQVKMAIHLSYACGGCGLRFTIVTSANAFEVALKLNKI